MTEENKDLTNIENDDTVKENTTKSRKASTSERQKNAKLSRKRPPIFRSSRYNIAPKKGYHYRIVSDKEYEYCVSRGYEPDPNYKSEKFQANRSQDPSQIGSARVSLGGEDQGTVMRIRQEYYDADQKEKHEMDKRKQAALLRPNVKGETISKSIEVKKVDYEDL